jgi:hypothetical protein
MNEYSREHLPEAFAQIGDSEAVDAFGFTGGLLIAPDLKFEEVKQASVGPRLHGFIVSQPSTCQNVMRLCPISLVKSALKSVIRVVLNFRYARWRDLE